MNLRIIPMSIFLMVSVQDAVPQTAQVREGQSSSSAEQLVHVAGLFYLNRAQDNFGSQAVVERTNSGFKVYPLPQSDVETYKKLRAMDAKNRWPPIRTAKDYERQEVIGPYQVEDGRIWFGNQYYDGEGDSGVGGFGYFDMKTRRYQLFSPPEIARWEISALLVDADAVWLGLDHFGEDISKWPGGLVRWDRSDHRVRRYPLEFLIEHIRRDTGDGSKLVLTTSGGYALFDHGKVQRFRVEKSLDGKEIAVRISRFPPPPSNQ